MLQQTIYLFTWFLVLIINSKIIQPRSLNGLPNPLNKSWDGYNRIPKSGLQTNSSHISKDFVNTSEDTTRKENSIEDELEERTIKRTAISNLNATCEVHADVTSFKNARQTFLSTFVSQESSDRIMYIGVNLNTSLVFLSSNERNSIEEWQWVLKRNIFFLEYPVDLDVITYKIMAPTYTENYVNISISKPELCNDSINLAQKIEELLWIGVFQNHTGSLLCNRNFKNDIGQKEVIFEITMAWIGYDLDCSIFLNRTKHTSVKAKSSVWLVAICFFLALYYPLLYKIVELRAHQETFNNIKSVPYQAVTPIRDIKSIMRRYTKNEVPFGFKRLILKTFFIHNCFCSQSSESSSKYIDAIRRLAYIKLSIYFCVLLCSTSIYRFYLYEQNSFRKYHDVYRVGFPIYIIRENTVANILLYFVSLLFGIILLVPVIVFATSNDESNDNQVVHAFCLLKSKEDSFTKISDLVNHESESSSHTTCFFTDHFIERFICLMSLKYWDTALKQCFCEKSEDKSRLICVFCLLIRIFIDIPSSLFPFIWLIFFGTHFLTSKSIDKTSSWALYIFLYIIFFLLFTWTQWVILSACINLIRTVIYIIFVAFSSSAHFLRIFFITITTIAYFGSFIVNYAAKYESILNFIFKVKTEMKKGYDEANQDQRRELVQVDDAYVSELEFDTVIYAFRHFREVVFWISFKTFLCLCFFGVSTIVLIKNQTFDDIKSDYIFKLAFIVITPKVLFDCLENKGNDNEIGMEGKEGNVKDIITKCNSAEDSSQCKRALLCCLCCSCTYDCVQGSDNMDRSLQPQEDTPLVRAETRETGV